MLAISGPADGLMIYNTDDSELFMYKNGLWNRSISTSSNRNFDEQLIPKSEDGYVLEGSSAGDMISGGLGGNTFIGKEQERLIHLVVKTHLLEDL